MTMTHLYCRTLILTHNHDIITLYEFGSKYRFDVSFLDFGKHVNVFSLYSGKHFNVLFICSLKKASSLYYFHVLFLVICWSVSGPTSSRWLVDWQRGGRLHWKHCRHETHCCSRAVPCKSTINCLYMVKFDSLAKSGHPLGESRV